MIGGVLIGLLILLFNISPGKKRVSDDYWNETYQDTDWAKNPYDQQIFRKMLPDLFPKNIVTYGRDREPLFYHFNFDRDELYNYGEFDDTTYFSKVPKELSLIYNKGGTYINRQDQKTILLAAKIGNEVFLSTEDFDEIFKYNLNIRTDSVDLDGDDNAIARFADEKKFKKHGFFYYKPNAIRIAFSEDCIDEKTKVIVKTKAGSPIIIEKKYGSGKVILCSAPRLFTDYNMLRSNNRFLISGTISHMKERNVYYTNSFNRKTYSSYGSTPDYNDSPRDKKPPLDKMKFINENPSLKWAFYMAIISVIMFIYFLTKRTQRPIPILRKMKNSTVEYILMMSDLYFYKGNHKNIAMKKINYFADYVRTILYINIFNADEKTILKLKDKTGVDEGLIDSIFYRINQIRAQEKVTQQELMDLNKEIEEFKNKIQS